MPKQINRDMEIEEYKKSIWFHISNNMGITLIYLDEVEYLIERLQKWVERSKSAS